MREQKKEPTPAKGLTRIGNRFHGTSKLHKGKAVCNAIKDGQNMAFLLLNMKNGLTVFKKIFRALEAKYIPFFDADFRESFYRTLQEGL